MFFFSIESLIQGKQVCDFSFAIIGKGNSCKLGSNFEGANLLLRDKFTFLKVGLSRNRQAKQNDTFNSLDVWPIYLTAWSRGYKKSCSIQLSMKIFLLINVKMPTVVGILIFMSRKKCILGLSELEKS